MIKIHNETIRTQPNFWSNCLFHPTDAVEDPWGKRILDRMAEDKAIKTIRIYTMFEDILYLDEDGGLQFDFRLSDLRLDYLVEKGYDLLLAYGGMPDCIASSNVNKTTVAKNKTRYKGKLFNTSPPKSDALWEEVCYEYTRHNVERYGIDLVSKWRCQCFNEPDIPWFFLSELPKEEIQPRVVAYCKMYAAFEKGIRRVSDKIPIGGPALAGKHEFLGGWLDFVKEKQLKLDFISVHNYGVMPSQLLRDDRVSIANNIEKHQAYLETIRKHGFENIPVIVDEWGLASGGFQNMEDCPGLVRRETEVLSAYYVKLIHAFIHMRQQIQGLFICLSGQHEMVEEFEGFRNFFTLSFIAKPIYNAHILASRLKENIIKAETESKDICVIPTRDDKGDYAVLLTYASEFFEDDLPVREEQLEFTEDLSGRKVTVWCIDKDTTNPYRLYQKMGITKPNEETIKRLREEGRLKPVYEGNCQGSTLPPIRMSSNAVVLITVT